MSQSELPTDGFIKCVCFIKDDSVRIPESHRSDELYIQQDTGERLSWLSKVELEMIVGINKYFTSLSGILPQRRFLRITPSLIYSRIHRRCNCFELQQKHTTELSTIFIHRKEVLIHPGPWCPCPTPAPSKSTQSMELQQGHPLLSPTGSPEHDHRRREKENARSENR